MDSDQIRLNALNRYKKDIESYQKEIEDLKDDIENTTDEERIKHLNKLLLESKRTLSSLLMKIQEYEE